MNKIIPFLQENYAIIKANLTMSSLTILSSMIIAKIFIFPFIKGKKKNLNYSKIKLNHLINLMNKSESIKLNNIIFLPFMNKILKMIKPDEEFETINSDDNDNVVKIKRTKKIIQKLTKEYIKSEEKNPKNKYESQKDKIFYFLLNNIHFINNNVDNITNKQIQVESIN